MDRRTWTALKVSNIGEASYLTVLSWYWENWDNKPISQIFRIPTHKIILFIFNKYTAALFEHSVITIQLTLNHSYTTHHLDRQKKAWKIGGQIGEASFDTPFMIQNHAESEKKIVGAL